MFEQLQTDNDHTRRWLTDHLAVDVIDNSKGAIGCAPAVQQLIWIQVDDYYPSDGHWDVDEWEDRGGHIYAPASRVNWLDAYRVARTLAKDGKASLITRHGKQLDVELPAILLLGGGA